MDKGGKEWPIPKKFHKLQNVTFEDSLYDCNIATSSVMINKAYFDKVGGFDESLRVCEDYDLWLRILKEGNIDLLPQKLLYKHAGEANQLSMTHKLLDRYHVKSLFKHAEREDVRTVIAEMINGLKKAGEKYGDEALLDECAVWEMRLGEKI